MAATLYFPDSSWEEITQQLEDCPRTDANEIECQTGYMDGCHDPILIVIPLHVIVSDGQTTLTMSHNQQRRGAYGGGARTQGPGKQAKVSVVRPYPRTLIAMDLKCKAVVVCFKVCIQYYVITSYYSNYAHS